MRAEAGVRRRGFTLVEVLVTIAIIVILVALFGGAISAARSGAQANTTTATIGRLDQIIATQFRRYESRSVPTSQLPAGITNPSAARAWHIRRNMITPDMPDRWGDVQYMATTGTAEGFPRTPAQAAYVATWNAASPKPTDQYGGAECLFMIVMQGGFADCLDCNGLAQLKKGDKDGDGALEFWDDWSRPIDYILWAPGFQKTGDTTPFFDSNAEDWKNPLSGTGSVRPALGMRPLIYSAGPDGKYGISRDPVTASADQATPNNATLGRGSNPTGRDCGNPAATTSGAASTPNGDGDRADNIVNVETKAYP